MNTSSRKVVLFAGPILLLVTIGAAVWWLLWPRYVIKRAEESLAAGDLVKAEELLKQLTGRRPKQPRAFFLYAQLMRRTNRHQEALEALRQALKLGYPKTEGHRELALNEAAINPLSSVEANLRKLLEEDPNDWEILQVLAERATRNDQWNDADVYYTRLRELQPDNNEYLLERGKARLTAARLSFGDMKAAAADFREILRRLPDHFEARLYLAQCLLSDAKMVEAKKELLTCRALQPNRVEPMLGLATCALEDQDWNEVQALLNRALKLEPNSVMALTMQGDLELRWQNHNQAIATYSKALRIDPRNKGVNLKLAQALRLSGRLEEAKAQERRFQELNEADPN
jgi:cytochrome c-type biogenesis protein CcmH/NrfG